jgi:molybdopterin converting factor small subunit
MPGIPPMARPVRILLFATAREAVGASQVEREVPAGGEAIGSLVDRLVGEFPRLRPVARAARFVRNGEYVRGAKVRVRPGDEIAIHPPYSGG